MLRQSNGFGIDAVNACLAASRALVFTSNGKLCLETGVSYMIVKIVLLKLLVVELPLGGDIKRSSWLDLSKKWSICILQQNVLRPEHTILGD